MEALKKSIREKLPQLVLVGAAAGFVMLVAELSLMEHHEGKQVIAIGASVLGAAAAGLALFASGTFRNALAVLMLAVGVTGVLGTVFHVAEAMEEAEEGRHKQHATLGIGSPAYAADEDEDKGRDGEGREGEEGEHGPPPLAPLSVSGLGMLGALGAVARKGKNEG